MALSLPPTGLPRNYGISTGMACFEAKRRCPNGVLCPPHYDEYRRLSLPCSRFWKNTRRSSCRCPLTRLLGFVHDEPARLADTTPLNYMKGIGEEFAKKLDCRYQAGWRIPPSSPNFPLTWPSPDSWKFLKSGKGISERPARARTVGHWQKSSTLAGGVRCLHF